MDPLLYKLIWVFGWLAVLLVFWHDGGDRRRRKVGLEFPE